MRFLLNAPNVQRNGIKYQESFYFSRFCVPLRHWKHHLGAPSCARLASRMQSVSAGGASAPSLNRHVSACLAIKATPHMPRRARGYALANKGATPSDQGLAWAPAHRAGSRTFGGVKAPRRTIGTSHARLGVLGRFYRHPTDSGPGSKFNLRAGAARSVPDLSPEPPPWKIVPSSASSWLFGGGHTSERLFANAGKMYG
jgi:hypothetical protein